MARTKREVNDSLAVRVAFDVSPFPIFGVFGDIEIPDIIGCARHVANPLQVHVLV